MGYPDTFHFQNLAILIMLISSSSPPPPPLSFQSLIHMHVSPAENQEEEETASIYIYRDTCATNPVEQLIISRGVKMLNVHWAGTLLTLCPDQPVTDIYVGVLVVTSEKY